MSNKQTGETGEKEVVEFIKCPNCGKKLILLPQSFPMFDIQCSGCLFRAQVKTVNSKPGDSILGAGWDIFEKVIKAGNLIPALIVNFKWKVGNGLYQEIRFYPFIALANIQKYKLSPEAKRANYWMFRYVGLNKVPYLTLFQQHK